MDEREFFERYTAIQRSICIERYKQLNKNVVKKMILFAGSSLAEQFPINEMLQSRKLSYKVYNRGVSGDTIDGLISELDTLILDLEPSKIFINIGSNDIGNVTYDEDVLFNKYINLLKKLVEKLPDTKIHVLSYYPVNPDKESFLDLKAKQVMFMNRNNKNICSINNRLKEYCIDNGLVYIDLYSKLLDERSLLDDSLTVEGIHLWPKAYECILDTLLPYFMED